MENKFSYRKRIKDRGIEWKERYQERSEKLKKRFDKQIGKGAYMRFEGHDYTTNSDYFIVVGPSLTREGRKAFFSGIKKLPDDPKAKVYAPSGEYFSNSVSAFSHASDKWALQYPRGIPNYSVAQLANIEIPRHVKGETMKIIEKKAIIEQSSEEFEGGPSSASALVKRFRILAVDLANKWNKFENEAEMSAAIEQVQTVLEQLLATTIAGRRRMSVPQSDVTQMARRDFIKEPIV